MADESHDKYPNEIDLGREVPDYGSPEIHAPSAESERPKKTVYPCLYVSGGDELKQIPEEGCFMIRAKRISLTTRESEEDDADVSIELEVHAICLGDGVSEEGEDSHEKLAEDLAEFIKEHAEGT